MREWAAELLERYIGLSYESARNVLHVIGVTGAALLFVFTATVIVAFNDFFASISTSSTLQVGAVATENILAPNSITYTSVVHTERLRQEAAANISQVYDPPDPSIARQQTQFARQILDFIGNIRRDPFGTTEQKVNDLRHITALSLPDDVLQGIVELSPEAWQAVDEQIGLVLERVMREPIRESDLTGVRNRLPTQVGINFNTQESAIIVSILEDLVRPNTFPNPEETQRMVEAAIEAVEPVVLTFARNEIIVRENERIDEAHYEALQQLNLLQNNNNRGQSIARAFLSTLLVTIITGLFIARFEPELLENSRFLILLATIFLIVLAGLRVAIATGQIYIYPSAAMALLLVSISSPQAALIATFSLGLLAGVITNNSLEITTLMWAGGLVGTLTLRRTERLNNFFIAGLIVGLTNTVVVTLFNLGNSSNYSANIELSVLVIYSLLNGILAAAVAIAGMYIVTQLFNLPTSLKLSDLSQPNQPLLQRLLREAPGTYQHSLQVGNLSEQAALAIGANAELVRVAALYHDIGKMMNPAFFTENQQFGGGNPHDALDDPYRSADIIISHVTDGEEMARQYRLPHRFRDFICEHHGTTQVYVFYRQAINLAGGDESAVDITDFTYPGPRPRSRETAIMMLADSCEAAVRSSGPTSKQEISEIIQNIVDEKMRFGQLDDSGLTLNDIKTIRHVFMDMLQAVFHPRINYQTAVEKPTHTPPVLPAVKATLPENNKSTQEISVVRPEDRQLTAHKTVDARALTETEITGLPKLEEPNVEPDDEDDDKPLTEVPPLPRTGEYPPVKNTSNGSASVADEEPVEAKDEETNH